MLDLKVNKTRNPGLPKLGGDAHFHDRFIPSSDSASQPAGYNTIPRQLVTVFAHSTSPAIVDHTQIPIASFKAISCSKPLPSVPRDVEDDPDGEIISPIESDISTTSAGSSVDSSMEADWFETNVRKQVARLDIDFVDHDLVRTEQPSVFGLRRRIVAAALDAESSNGKENPTKDSKDSKSWLGTPGNGQWKPKILKKKLSFSKKVSEPLPSMNNAMHDPMPDMAAARDGRAPLNPRTQSHHDKMLKRDKQLAEKEKDFDLAVLSRFETAELKMIIYTEHRQGSWVIKGPSEPGADPLDEPPLIYSPWDVKIDSRGIVERKKLRSFIELSDTTCDVVCTICSSYHHRQIDSIDDSPPVECSHCAGRGSVKATYVVCVTLRQSTFLPLKLPIRHLAGKHQGSLRPYLPKTTIARSHVDLLRMRSMEAIRSCALRVGRAHSKEHEARLLMAKAVLERRSCNSVVVVNRHSGLFRSFDITDGGFIQMNNTPGFVEEESRISETPELTDALSTLRITAVTSEGIYRFVDLDSIDVSSAYKTSSPARSTLEVREQRPSSKQSDSASSTTTRGLRQSKSSTNLHLRSLKSSKHHLSTDSSRANMPKSPSTTLSHLSMQSQTSFETAHTSHSSQSCPRTYSKAGVAGTYI